MGGGATILLNVAYQNAPPPLLASIDYLAVPFCMAAGVVIWSESIGALTAAGCTIVMTAGLLSLSRDHLTRYVSRALRAARGIPDIVAGRSTERAEHR